MKEGTRSGGSNEEGCEPQSNQAVVSTDSGGPAEGAQLPGRVRACVTST